MTSAGYCPQEPIAAIATALSPAAIGIVRTSGRGSIELAARIFSRPAALLKAEGNSLIYGWIVERGADGKIESRIDEVMLGVYREPASFTGEEMVEIFCHGGISVVKSVQALLLRSGFRQALRGEFTFRAYINGKADLTRAEAVKEIIDSKTNISRGKAAGRLAGNLYRKIDLIKQDLTRLLASIEVAVEYPEDEETIADSFDLEALRSILGELEGLLSGWRSERLYQEGARVVLAGRTNAGKSSLFNALLKEDRSIVSDVEGTTRDYLENLASLDGIPVRLFDTAGLRETDDPVEGEGVLRSRTLAGEADILLYLVDSTIGLDDDDRKFLSSPTLPPAVLVWNKCDKGNSLPVPSGGTAGGNWKLAVSVSAKTGLGMGTLIAGAKGLLSGGSTDGHSSGSPEAALGSERQRAACAAAAERIAHAVSTAGTGELGLDAVVQDLEDALASLGEITGEVTSDDVLESIFSNFCVGK